jgi:hypothetical protein
LLFPEFGANETTAAGPPSAGGRPPTSSSARFVNHRVALAPMEPNG